MAAGEGGDLTNTGLPDTGAGTGTLLKEDEKIEEDALSLGDGGMALSLPKEPQCSEKL